MKIVNVHLGLLPIPPNGWGAIEKIIWEYHTNLIKLGHHSEIRYLNQIQKDEFDVVHVHAANLALELYNLGIPYYFSMHDHHAFYYGKDSFVFKQNLEAIEKSVKSFLPAKYLVDYFGSKKGMYFSHGVNTEFFTPIIDNTSTDSKEGEFKLLCVANNGYVSDNSEDRKGFIYAIEAAKLLDFPITIAGPKNNEKFFERYKPEYNKLTIKYDLTEEELLQTYKEHDIFLHPSELEAGHPNLTLLEAMACGLPVVSTFEANNSLEGMEVVTRNTTDLIKKIIKITLNYEKYQYKALQQAKKLNWYNRTERLVSIYQNSNSMKDILIDAYENTPIVVKEPKKVENNINIHFVQGPFVEITGIIHNEYNIKFIDKKTNIVQYETNITTNHWTKCDLKYFIDWEIHILNKTKNEKHVYNLDLKDRKVFITFESKAVGDTLAWLPYIEEFRLKHKCELICSTFHNDLFKDVYQEIKFVAPGHTEYDLMAMYSIGWFYDENNQVDKNRHPKEFKDQSLQKTATDILGLNFKEAIPKYKTSKWKEWHVIRDNFSQENIIPEIIDKVFLERDSKGFSIQKYKEGKYNSCHLVYNENFEHSGSLRGNIYERENCVIEENDIVVDLGANIGCFTNFALKAGAKKVFAYEPSVLAFKCLNNNAVSVRVCIYQKLVTNVDNSVKKLYIDKTSDVGNSTLKHDNSSEIYDEVPTITLETILKNIGSKIDFLKIDIEGSEKEIFDSTPDSCFKDITKIAIEYHNILGDDYRNTLINKLLSYGYNVWTEIGLDTCIIYCTKVGYVPKNILTLTEPKTQKAAIAIHGTAQAKYWNNPKGWQETVDYLNSKKYEVTLLSKEGRYFMGNIAPNNIKYLPEGSLMNLISELENSDLFIGIGSGLSWLSWMTGTPTILISGFSDSYTEPSINTYRITAPKDVCQGCFNTQRLDPGDWNWCPVNKNTPKQFECSKKISSKEVIKEINKII